jgi:hypothetical protein
MDKYPSLIAIGVTIVVSACTTQLGPMTEVDNTVDQPVAANNAPMDCEIFNILTDDDERYPLTGGNSYEAITVWFRNAGDERLAQDVDCPMGVEFCEDAGLHWYLYDIEFSRDGQQWTKTVYWAPNDVKIQNVFPDLVDGQACFKMFSTYDPTPVAALHYYFLYYTE